MIFTRIACSVKQSKDILMVIRTSVLLCELLGIMSTSMTSGAKRKAAPSISPPAIKRKVTSTTTVGAIADFFTPASQKSKPTIRWTERSPNPTSSPTLLIGQLNVATDANLKPGAGPRKIAAFDFDSTLITTLSGKKHGKEAGDWKWWDPSVPARLKSLYSDGYHVVIFTNQAGIELHRDLKSKAPQRNIEERVSTFKTKVGAVFTALDIPTLVIYAATGRDIFRKPRMGMWHAMCDDLKIVASSLQLEESFFVGDAAGRTAALSNEGRDTTPGAKTKQSVRSIPKDFSCSDRNFAHNIGIRFLTPEEYFRGESPRPFVQEISLELYPYDGGLVTQPFTPLFKSTGQKEVVVFCGPPGAGKSSFYWKHLEPQGYKRVNQDILKTRSKCLKVASDHLALGDSVVVDSTNPDIDTRSQWINLARQHGALARCIWFRTPLALCKHNDAVRAFNATLNPEARELLPQLAFNGFSARFKEPVGKEGFEDILQVDFNFRGTEEEYQVWSKYWI